MNKLVLNNFLGGIGISKYSGGNTYRNGVGIDPFSSDEHPGDFGAGWAPLEFGATPITTAISKFISVDMTGAQDEIYAYSPTKIYQITGVSGTEAVTSDATYPLTIANGVSNGGMVFHKQRILYANGSTQVGRFTPGATPAQTDAAFTGLNSNTTRRHFTTGMGIAFISNDNFVATINDPTGADALPNKNLSALDFPSGFSISGLLFWKDRLVIATFDGNSTSATINKGASIYFWDTLSENWYSEFKLPEVQIYNLIEYQGTIWAQGDNYWYAFDGISFKKVFYIGPRLTTVAQDTNLRRGGPEEESAVVWRNFILWKNSDHHIIAYGNIDPRQPKIITIPFKATVGTTLSAIFSTRDRVYISRTDDTSLYVYKTGNGKNTGVVLYTNEIAFNSPVKFYGVRVGFQNLASGDSGAVNLITRQNDSNTGTSTEIGTITYASDGDTINSKLLIFPGPIEIQQFHLSFDFDAGSIVFHPGIIIYYEPIEEPYYMPV